MCPPMVEYVNGLKTELAVGTMIRLTSVVEKMKRVVKNSHLELEEARKKVRVEEKRKSEALIKLKEVEEKGKAMRDFVGHLLEAKKKSKAPLVSHRLQCRESNQYRQSIFGSLVNQAFLNLNSCKIIDHDIACTCISLQILAAEHDQA
ncbi:hypothetical protein GIB67_016577 [Kingdonia uniflora]|uniref:Uncharacterized protein n=1 Tax=Kingdonia uniflora TaxID=39325 RepID=A0A7J7MYY4_9MAGN|nr:hypothetical protein GIB67_016577 [Kingdonia uniflora]